MLLLTLCKYISQLLREVYLFINSVVGPYGFQQVNDKKYLGGKERNIFMCKECKNAIKSGVILRPILLL